MIERVFIDEQMLFDAKYKEERIEGQFEIEFDEGFPIVNVLNVRNDFGKYINLTQAELFLLEGKIAAIIIEQRGECL